MDSTTIPRIDRPRSDEAVWLEVLRSVPRRMHPLRGLTNLNYQVRLSDEQARAVGLSSGASVLVRTRRQTISVAPYMWPDEFQLLRHLGRAHGGQDRVAPLPFYEDGKGTLVLEFVEGRTLCGEYPKGSAVPQAALAGIMAVFGSMARVDTSALPPVTFNGGWPEDGDSSAFLRHLASLAESEVAPRVHARLGALLERLRVPKAALRPFADAVPRLHPRPFRLLHGDLHRANLVVRRNEGSIKAIDWEFAKLGDPLYDLSVHLVRMQYPSSQQSAVIGAWKAELDAVDTALTLGLRDDLRIYLAFERAQSVYPDILRAALSLGADIEEATLTRAVARIESALHHAAAPLSLGPPPDRMSIERSLRDWHRSRLDRS